MIVECPMCKNGVVIDPSNQNRANDEGCETCFERGFYNTDFKCICGRPAVQLVAHNGATHMACGDQRCVKKAAELPKVEFEKWGEGWTRVSH